MRHVGDSPARIGRVLAYRRVSTRDQEVGGTSLDAQKAEIERHCAAHGLPSPLDFVEMESGGEESEEKRKEVARLLAGIRQGDAVIVSKIDRFARDMVFIVKNVRAIRKKGACFISLAECFDSRRPESDMMLGAWAMAADMERRRILERTQGPRKRLRSQGLFVEGRAPFGYRRASDGSRRLVIEPDEAHIVKEVFDLAANGLSLLRIRASIQRKYGDNHGRRFGLTWVSRGLRNRVYTGQLSRTPVRPNKSTRTLPGDWIDTHEPIVTSDLFAVAQIAINTRRPGRKPEGQSLSAGYLMRGLARCSICNLTVRAVAPSARDPKPGYYVCNRRLRSGKGGDGCPDAPYLRQTTTDEVLTQRTVTFLKAITKALAHPPTPIKKPAFDAQRAAVRQKRDRVIKLVAENITTLEAATNTLHEIDVQLGLIDAGEAEHKASLTQDTAENRHGAKAYFVQVLDEWDSFPIDVRRGIIGSLVREITLGKDKQLRIVHLLGDVLDIGGRHSEASNLAGDERNVFLNDQVEQICNAD